MRHSNITATHLIENQHALKKIKHGKDCQYEKVEASKAKANGKPPPGDKPLGLIQISNYFRYKTVTRLRRERKHKPLYSLLNLKEYY